MREGAERAEDLAGADFAGADFAGADFAGVDFAGVFFVALAFGVALVFGGAFRDEGGGSSCFGLDGGAFGTVTVAPAAFSTRIANAASALGGGGSADVARAPRLLGPRAEGGASSATTGGNESSSRRNVSVTRSMSALSGSVSGVNTSRIDRLSSDQSQEPGHTAMPRCFCASSSSLRRSAFRPASLSSGRGSVFLTVGSSTMPRSTRSDSSSSIADSMSRRRSGSGSTGRKNAVRVLSSNVLSSLWAASAARSSASRSVSSSALFAAAAAT
ncbi:MAG: hypothetical protein HOW73_23435 [Polyangiaceae bacterium]|nr:hypothetical protein [Polyangiaceae bacterium]